MEYILRYHSPLGKITMASDGTALTGLWFDGQKYFAQNFDPEHQEKSCPIFDETARWLALYFEGKDPGFTPPLSFHATSFREFVWRILLTIPYGQTMTYKEIGSDGSLTGYAGGIERKKMLLDLERSSLSV